jgi:hypothetical protein
MIIGSYALFISQVFFHCYHSDAFGTSDIQKNSYTFLQYSSQPSLIVYRDFNNRIHTLANTIYSKHRSNDPLLLARIRLDEDNTLKRLCMRIRRIRESAVVLHQAERGKMEPRNDNDNTLSHEGSVPNKISQILVDSKCMNTGIYFDELDKNSNTPKGEEITNILTIDGHKINPIPPTDILFFSQCRSDELIRNDHCNNDNNNIGNYDTLLARNCLVVEDSYGKGKGLFTTIEIEEGIHIGDYQGEKLCYREYCKKYPKGIHV